MNTIVRLRARGPAAAVQILSLGALLASAPAAAADDPAAAPLAPGIRVRIEAPGLAARDVIGRINTVGDQVIRIDVPGRAEPVTVARDQITRLQVSTGRSSRLIHAFVGAAIGAIVGVIAANHGSHQSQFPGEVAATGAVVALVGAGIGAALPAGEHWRDQPAASYRVGLVPNPGSGFALSFSRGF